jgi:hypothetical protein
MMYRMNLISFEKKWLKKIDNTIAESILNDAGLPKTADKEMIWTKEEERGRELNRLQDLQVACFINYQTTHILNKKNIGSETTKVRIEEARKYINKYFMIKNMNFNKG